MICVIASLGNSSLPASRAGNNRNDEPWMDLLWSLGGQLSSATSVLNFPHLCLRRDQPLGLATPINPFSGFDEVGGVQNKPRSVDAET
jgi:hypothetical protein